MALFSSKERKNAKKVEEAWELLNAGRTDKAVSKISMVAIGGYAPAEYLMAVAAWKMGNIKDAVFWRKSAAEKGVADAQQLLEQLQGGNAGSTDRTRLLDSYYDNKDWANAAKLATEMTAEGDSYAANLLANMYYAGTGVKQDYAKALELYKQSAQRGYVGGVANLGRFYDNAEGYKDPAKATEYHIQAAEKGRPSAMYRLGKAYENGSGIEQNMDKAVLWYYKAQQQGYSLADKRLNEIKNEICGTSVERKEFDRQVQLLVERDNVEREEKQRLAQQEKEFAEQKAKAEAEEKARIEAEMKAKSEAEEKARIEAKQKAEEEEKARLKAELKAKIEAQVRAEMEAEMKAKAEAEENARMEAARKAKADALRYGEEMINKARSLCAGGDFENGEKVVRELLANQPDNRSALHLLAEIEDVKAYDAQQAAEKAAKEEAERKAKAEAEVKARLEAEVKAKAEAEEKARITMQQADVQKNTDEIFTAERLDLMQLVSLRCTREHNNKHPYQRTPADDELDWAEDAYRKGDYEKAYRLRTDYEDYSPRAINMLGAMRLTGRGAKKDGATAIRNFETAARQEYVPAYYNMGMVALNMDNNPKEAMHYFEKGAEEGNIRCMLRRAELYKQRRENDKDRYREHLFWMEVAAKSGDLTAAKYLVELFFTKPEYTNNLYMYLKLLADAGDNEICAKAAQILSTGVEGKMKPLPMSAEYFTELLKSRGQANIATFDNAADEAEKNEIRKSARQIYNMSADQLGTLRRQMLKKDMADEADQITEFVLDNRWFDIWYDFATTGSGKYACDKWEKYKDAVDRNTYSQHYYRLDAAHHFALKAETLSQLETDEDDAPAWVIGGTVISGAFVPDMLMELANATETVMILDPFDNFQMAMLNKDGLLQITEDAMVGDKRYFIIRTADSQRPQIDSDTLITYFHEYNMADELYCPVLDYSYDISQIKLRDMIFVHYFKDLYDTVKTPAEKEQVMKWLDRKYLDAAKMHIRNNNPVSTAYIVRAVLDYFPEYDAAKQLEEELSRLMD